MLRRDGFRFGFCEGKSATKCLVVCIWVCDLFCVKRRVFINLVFAMNQFFPFAGCCIYCMSFFYAHDLVRGAAELMVDWYLENFVYDKLWFVFCKNRSARLKRLNALFYSKISAKFDLMCEWYSSQNHCKVDLETACCECFNFFSRLERLNALFSSKISAKVDLVCEWYSSQNHCKVDMETACCECFDFCKNRFARLEGLNALFSTKILAKVELVCEWYSSQNPCMVDLETGCW